jgi:hypothetical protein
MRPLSSGPGDRQPARPIEWIAALGLLVAFLVIALLTLPKGPPLADRGPSVARGDV